MPVRIPQSVAIRVPLKAYLTSDHVSAATGKTIAIVISKNGAAFANPSGGATNAVEIGNGWYYVDLTTTDTGTLGPVIVRGTSASVDDVEIPYQVVDATNLGASNLDASVSSRSTYAGADTSGTTTLLTRIPGTVAAQTGDSYARLGSPAGASHAADIAAVKTDTAAVKTQTDKLTFTVANQIDANVLDWKSSAAPAMTGDAFARLGAPAGASVSADVAAVNTKTTNLPASPAAVSDIPTANANADALLDRAAGVETSWTVRQAMRIMLSALGGKLAGAATSAVTVRDMADSKNRISATVDSNGNRTAVTLDPS